MVAPISAVAAPVKLAARASVKSHARRNAKAAPDMDLTSVEIDATRPSASEVPTQRQQFNSSQSRKVIDRRQLSTVSAGGGSAQALEIAPGVHVNGYGSGNTTRYSISINGIKQGWGGEPSGAGIDYGAIGVTFDGVPLNNPGTGLFQTTLVNQLSLIDGIGVTYGPGEVRDRWFTDIGGRIDFIPVQPASEFGGRTGLVYGSFNTRGAHALLQTGEHGGYSAVIGAGYTYADSFRQSVDGFNNGSHASAIYAKVRKDFDDGSLSLGAYVANARAYRPTAIPVDPISDVTINGYDPLAYDGTGAAIPGPLYSQKTTGFYSALPYDVWHKLTKNQTGLLYSKLNLDLDDTTTLHNLIWYQHEQRLHDHYNNFVQNQDNLFEYNNPYSHVFGDRITFDVDLDRNLLSFGGYYINSIYNTHQSFYNPNEPYNGSIAVPNAKYRSNYWNQDKVALFAQDKISLLPNLYVTPGVRWVSYATLYTNGGAGDFPINEAQQIGTNQGQLPNARTRFYAVEPSVGVHWKVLRNVAVYANYGEAHKEPQNGGGGGPYQDLPASQIHLEKGRDLQGGVKVHVDHGRWLHHFLFEANVYQLNFSRQIIEHTLANGDNISAFGSSVYRGVNLSASDDLTAHLYLFANASYEFAHFKNYSPDGQASYDGLPVAYVPDTTFNLGAAYAYRIDGIKLVPRVNLRYTGTQHMFDDNTNQPSSQTVPSYTLVDLGAQATIPVHSLGVRDVKLGFNVDNLLDRHYNAFEFISAGGYFGTPESIGKVLAYPGAGRAVFGTLSVDF